MFILVVLMFVLLVMICCFLFVCVGFQCLWHSLRWRPSEGELLVSFFGASGRQILFVVGLTDTKPFWKTYNMLV